jgi:hypothetical protein
LSSVVAGDEGGVEAEVEGWAALSGEDADVVDGFSPGFPALPVRGESVREVAAEAGLSSPFAPADVAGEPGEVAVEAAGLSPEAAPVAR